MHVQDGNFVVLFFLRAVVLEFGFIVLHRREKQNNVILKVRYVL